jgi:ubiquinone/menaquinone biosynthesis C-methylase UbiE
LRLGFPRPDDHSVDGGAFVLSQLIGPREPLAQFPLRDGVREISPPQRFDGGEEAYDDTAGGGQKGDLLASGLGAWRLAQHYARRPLQHWLEIGAGGGACTLGLVAAAPARTKIITDTSPAFLAMIRRKLAALGVSGEGCVYATLDGDHLDRLPPKSLDAIYVASAVHHVGDWRGFFRAAAGVLAPGGVLVIQEPFREGFLLMNMALEIVLAAEWAGEMCADDLARITRCRDATYFLSDTTLEKIGEDKHTFLIDDMAAACDAAGFVRHVFHRNAHFENFGHQEELRLNTPCTFAGYLLAFLGIHHRVSEPGLEVLRRRLAPILQPIERLFVQGDGPALLASVVCVR